MTQNVLVLGANGRFGSHAAMAFENAGWTVKRFNRATGNLQQAVQGMDVVVNAWNPPDYSTWTQQMLPLHKRVIDAVKGSQATIVLPGNVYVFGANTSGPWSETTPHQVANTLGALRIEMEAMYRNSGLRTILLRGGDFLDVKASGQWFDRIIVQKLRKGQLTYPGDLNTRHSWAFLPDIARAAVALAAMRDDLPTYADVPFPGYTVTARDMTSALARAIKRPVAIKRMSWLPLYLLSPVMRSLRGLLDMRYLWDTPHGLDATRFDALLPEFEHTPLESALAQATAHAVRA